MSSKCDSQKSRFLRVSDEYLKNDSTDFHQTYVIFKQSSKVTFEIKTLKTGHSLLPWQQVLEGGWTKNHELREEKWHFLKILNQYCIFELRFKIRSLKCLLTPNFSLLHPKTKEK